MGLGGRARGLSSVAKHVFHLVTQKNLQLTMTYVPSQSNPADSFSRKLTQSECWRMVQEKFGGTRGHTLDLMSLDSNAQRDLSGSPLRHFTPYPTPGSAGVDVFRQDLRSCDGVMVNAYAFPPFALISPLLSFLRSQRAVTTLVVPSQSPLPSWWPTLIAMSIASLPLAEKGCQDALLTPTKHGFKATPLIFDLWAFRLARF